MKRPLFLMLGIVASISILVWVGSIVYWQVRLRLAVRSCERDAKVTPRGVNRYDLPEDSERVLGWAGCRSIPYLLAARETSANPAFQQWISDILSNYPVRMAELGNLSKSELESIARLPEEGGRPGREKEFQKALWEWSREHTARVHPWWAPWAGTCLPTSD